MSRARILADYVSSGDELALKAPLASPTFTGNFTSVGIDDNADATAITINANEQVLIKQTAGVTGYTGYGAGLHVQGDTTSGSYAVPFVIKSADHDKAIIDVWEARDSANSAEFHVRNPDDGANRFVVTTSDGDVTVNTGNLVIGTAGKGVMFHPHDEAVTGPPGSDSNLLDDYEEGTWNPHVNGSTTTYCSDNHGKYQKVGNTVTCQFKICIDSIGNGSASTLYGFPFNSANLGTVQTGHCSYFANLVTSVTFIAFYVENDTNTCLFISSTGSASGTCQNGTTVFGSSATLFGAVTYMTA